MPPSQYSEFNRCIDLMNLANRELALAIGFLARMVREAQLREAWLIDMTMWREQIDELVTRCIRLSRSLKVQPKQPRGNARACAV
jgi:hypothetical protein